MGAFSSRQNAAVEEAEQISSHAYKYPPRSGNFFGSHFIMGGERFDTPQPEAYLFGENADLNFLGNRPTAFPYPPPQANEPTKTLKSLINIRKESVRFVRVQEKLEEADGNVLCTAGVGDLDENNTVPERAVNCSYNIEFTFDCDAKCAITIYYFCNEEVSPSGVTLVPRDGLTSETYHYEKGMSQFFSQPSHIFKPQLIPEDDLIYNPAKEQYPVAIHCVVEEGNDECRQSHTTICVIDHHTDCSYVLRALKQKIFVDGLCYLLQEIYGIENKAVNKSTIDEDLDDHGSECVICMSETRDTLILPCRHLCLCNSCADSLRYQANNCPICRAPFRALLQIRAVQKGVSSSLLHQSTPAEPVCDQHIPVGYIPVSLIEALNGPPQYAARTRDTTDSLNTAGNITGDNGNHKPTSPHKTNSHRRSKNKKNAVSVMATNNADASPKNNEINSVATKNNQNISHPAVEVASTEGSANIASVQKKSPKPDGKVDKLSSRHSQDKLQIVNERSSLKLPKCKRNAGSNLGMNNNNNSSPATHNEADDDSENEKLSPLLSPGSKFKSLPIKQTKITKIDGVEESSMINDVDSSDELENTQIYDSLKKHKRPALTNSDTGTGGSSNQVVLNADDSDYYTPEDTQNSILSPLCPEKAKTAGDKLGGISTKSNTNNFKSANSLAMKNLHKKSTSVGNIVGPTGGVGAGADLKGNVSSLPDMLDGPIGSGGNGGNSASTRSSSDSYSSSSSTKQLLSSNPTTTAANIIVDDKTALQNAVNV